MNVNYQIKEHSWIAKIAAKKLKATAVAMVLGKTIHLFGSSKADFLADDNWVKHELCHVKQFKEHGYFIFIVKYLWESLRVGYYNNKYEVEARAAEC
ncbi:MAG: DUF4157 domain-containing protein [Ferruginibacter sp.]|nr:DUF4157 domain-containing protein [Ferruginibacter sp.]